MEQIGPRRRPEVLADRLPDGSAVLFDPREEMVYAISATGAHLWDACDGTRPLPAPLQRRRSDERDGRWR